MELIEAWMDCKSLFLFLNGMQFALKTGLECGKQDWNVETKLTQSTTFVATCIKQLFIIYVIAREGVKFGINFMSCSENGNEIARGAAECYFAVIATTSGIYLKISLLPVLSQINTIACFVKVKISDFQTHFHNE